jgi:hypothetical protein
LKNATSLEVFFFFFLNNRGIQATPRLDRSPAHLAKRGVYEVLVCFFFFFFFFFFFLARCICLQRKWREVEENLKALTQVVILFQSCLLLDTL